MTRGCDRARVAFFLRIPSCRFSCCSCSCGVASRRWCMTLLGCMWRISCSSLAPSLRRLKARSRATNRRRRSAAARRPCCRLPRSRRSWQLGEVSLMPPPLATARQLNDVLDAVQGQFLAVKAELTAVLVAQRDLARDVALIRQHQQQSQQQQQRQRPGNLTELIALHRDVVSTLLGPVCAQLVVAAHVYVAIERWRVAVEAAPRLSGPLNDALACTPAQFFANKDARALCNALATRQRAALRRGISDATKHHAAPYAVCPLLCGSRACYLSSVRIVLLCRGP